MYARNLASHWSVELARNHPESRGAIPRNSDPSADKRNVTPQLLRFVRDYGEPDAPSARWRT
jgi:hypothetical protein